MGTKTAIEWTESTWTPIRALNIKTRKIGWHCEHATTGCEFCYAEGINKRLGTGLPFKPGHRKDVEIFLDEEMLKAPLHWKRPRKVFVCSMSDLFAEFVQDEWIDRMFAVMALCPQHTFQVLTKRAERMRDYFIGKVKYLDIHPLEDRHNAINNAMDSIAPPHWCKRELQDYSEEGLPLPNCWLGVSSERQQEADERIPLLLQTPAAVRFISAEPLLGQIDLMMLRRGGEKVYDAIQGVIGHHIGDGEYDGAKPCAKLDLVIVGGESGPNARPMHPQWARYLRDQCAAAGIPFFYKQTGEWSSFAVEGLSGNERKQRHTMRDPHLVEMVRVGKKTAGRMLDGREHNEMPARAE